MLAAIDGFMRAVVKLVIYISVLKPYKKKNCIKYAAIITVPNINLFHII